MTDPELVGKHLVHEPPAHAGENPDANETKAKMLFDRFCAQVRVRGLNKREAFLSTLELRKTEKNMNTKAIVLGSLASLTLSGAVMGDFIIYTDPGAFFAAIDQAGKVSKGFWDFKPNNVPAGFISAVDDPLNFITAPGTGIWDNMPLDNIQFQSNLNPFGDGGPNPRGIGGLAFATAPFFGIKNNILVANTFVDSFDILSGVPKGDNHTAMAMNVVSLASGGGAVTVTVWDKNEEHKTSVTLAGPWQDNEKRFVGILAIDERSIGRVNIYDDSNGAEGISAIEVFVVPAPGAMALLGLAGLCVRRRRRR